MALTCGGWLSVHMSEQGAVAKALESPAIVIVGSVADFAAVFVLLNSEPILLWVSGHPRSAILVAASLTLLLIGLLNAWLRARSIAHRSQIALMEMIREPTLQDRERFVEFQEDFGVDSDLYYWLKNDYMVDKAGGKDLRALRRVLNKWNDDLTNYHDSELAAAFSSLREALSEVRLATITYYWPTNRDTSLIDNTIYSVPPEWELGEKGRWEEAIYKLETVHDTVMEAYLTFINLAHQKKVTTK
jgi:hypothetical protein